MKDNKLLMPSQVAEYYGVSINTVRRWVKQGKLASVETPGGHSRILAKEFFLAAKSRIVDMDSQAEKQLVSD